MTFIDQSCATGICSRTIAFCRDIGETFANNSIRLIADDISLYSIVNNPNTSNSISAYEKKKFIDSITFALSGRNQQTKDL